jgi:hypothetical protein
MRREEKGEGRKVRGEGAGERGRFGRSYLCESRVF